MIIKSSKHKIYTMRHALMRAQIHTRTYARMHAYVHTHTAAQTHSFTRSLTHSHTLSFTRSLIHTLTHMAESRDDTIITHTHTHTLTHTLTHSLLTHTAAHTPGRNWLGQRQALCSEQIARALTFFFQYFLYINRENVSLTWQTTIWV